MRELLYKALVSIRAVPPPPRPLTWESFFGESSTLLAGVSIDESNALNYSPIWCGVTTLSRDIAKLPLEFYRNTKNGGKEKFKEHRLYRILHDEPNPEMTSYKFRETMQALCLLYGNAYAEIVRDALGRPAGMYPLVPTRVCPMRTEAGRLFYRVTNYSGGVTDVAAANMIHLSSLSTDGVLGHGIVMHARESIGLGVATEKFGASFFGNGTTFGGVVEVPGTLKGKDGEETKESVRKLIESVHAGVERAHKILVLGAGSKFTERGTKPNEAQFIETRKFQISETARWLAMPPHKLGDLENAHFTNIEEENIAYHVGTVSGWLEMWEQELSRKLISPLEYHQQTIEHNTDGALRGDSTKRGDFYAKMHAIGVFSINDILRKENMNPIGPEGDAHLVPLNMIPAERFNEYIDATIKAKTAPPPALPAPKDDDEEEDDERMLALVEEIRSANRRAEEHVARAVTAEAQAARESEQRAAFEAIAQQERQAAADAAEALRVARAELTAATEARAAAAQLADDRAAQAAALEADLVAARTEAAAAAEVAPALAEARGVAAQAQAALEQRTAALDARKADECDRLSRLIASHRANLVDVVVRLLRPEVDRARRHQSSPESLRKWAAAFYQTHRDVCTDALYPALLTHHALKRSDADARAAARELAEAHCAQSEQQLAALVTRTEPDEFHRELEQLLLRWEQDRPAAVADTLLADEIRYLGELP